MEPVLRSSASSPTQTIRRQERDGPQPLSFPQERLFLLDRIMPGLAAYNVPTLVRVGATIDESLLKAALEEIVARHEILRTTVRLIDGVPAQEVSAHAEVELAVSDLRSRQPGEREAEAQALLGAFANRPFDISSDVLLRAALVHLDTEDLLLIVLHHIGSDHASSAILFRELDEIYDAMSKGEARELAELPIQYTDFARWQREQLGGSRLEELLAHWTSRLVGAPERLELPSDRPRPSSQSFRGKLHELTIGPELAQPLRAQSRRHGVSMFMFLLAAFKVLLHRYTGAEDMVVGAPASGRHYEETADLLGFFSNTLALRTDLSGDPTFAELLQRVKVTTLEAQIYQELPFEKLVEALNPQRSQSYSPIFQVLFGYDVYPAQPPRLAGKALEQLPIPGWQWSRFDLSIVARELRDGSLHAQLEYATDLFDAATVERLIGHYTTLLTAVGRDCDRPLSELPILTEQERSSMLTEWNATSRPYDRRCLHELVSEQAARSPETIAVVSERDRLSYGELEARSNQLARELIDAGVGVGSLVGMCLERSVELPVAMLAVLKTGAAYVPIDPTYPPERQELMLADAHAPVLITQSRFLGVVGPSEATVLCVDRDRPRIDRRSTEPIAVEVDPEQRAYVIYTSGSTGQPKGVEITHRSVANLLAHMRERPGLSARDVLANVTTPAFDLSVPDWYLPLTTGARLLLVPREATLDGVELADWLARSGATFMQATPTTWQLLLDASWTGSAGLKIVCGGEALPRALARELQSRGESLWHMYGPTETTVWSSIMKLEPGDGPALGGPIANTRFYVLDGSRQPVPIGVPGELFIGGDGLARGYHDRAELTADRFVDDPFTPSGGARLYRTGDLVRWREGGTLEFLGRIDQQVKLRGFRIELGEVEALLEEHREVSAAVAVVREDSPGDQRLIAYFAPADGRAVELEQLRRLCKARLPPFMVPSGFVSLDAFPLTANGKLNRNALPAPDGARPSLGDSYLPPQTPVERTLVSIWSEILGVARIGLDDDFFDLGGHSLLAVRMLARVRESFDLDLHLHRVFEHSTVRELAATITADLLDAADEDELSSLLAEIETVE
jgi:amino acid adenylation domain-containing protein